MAIVLLAVAVIMLAASNAIVLLRLGATSRVAVTAWNRAIRAADLARVAADGAHMALTRAVAAGISSDAQAAAVDEALAAINQVRRVEQRLNNLAETRQAAETKPTPVGLGG